MQSIIRFPIVLSTVFIIGCIFLLQCPCMSNATIPEPETTAEPGPATSSEPIGEPEGSTEPSSETIPTLVSGEPITTRSEPEGEPEGSAEPTGEPEGSTEPTGEPEGSTEPTGEPEVTSTSEAEPEPEDDPTGDPEKEPDAYAEKSPTAYEIIFPPFGLMVVICSGLFGLWLRALLNRNSYEKTTLARDFFTQPSLANISSAFRGGESGGLQEVKEVSKYAFLSLEDIELMHGLELFFNQPLPLCRIAAPALLSLAFCPLVLYIYGPVTQFFWPPSEYPRGVPDINDAIACFLAPAGLVYATSFGFSYQSAMQKQRSLMSTVSNEVSRLDQIIVMTSHLTYITLKEKAKIYKHVKDEAITIIRQIQGLCKSSTLDYKGTQCSGQIWRIVPTLRNSGVRQTKWHLDRHILDSMMDHVVALNSDSSERYEVMNSRIHPLKWLFLELLGFFSFFGVLLLRAGSYRMELAMCIMTVFSITMLCYVVADLDSPFNGFFRVNMDCLTEIVYKANVFYTHALEGKNVDGPSDPGATTADGCLDDTIHDSDSEERAKKPNDSVHSLSEVVLSNYEVDDD